MGNVCNILNLPTDLVPTFVQDFSWKTCSQWLVEDLISPINIKVSCFTIFTRLLNLLFNIHSSTDPGTDFVPAYSQPCQPWGIQAVWNFRLLHDQAEITRPLWHDAWWRILRSLVRNNFDFYSKYPFTPTHTNTPTVHTQYTLHHLFQFELNFDKICEK